MDKPDVDIGPQAQQIVDFFSSLTFKVICSVLIVIGIAYGISTGGLVADRIPSPAEQVEKNRSKDRFKAKHRPGWERASQPKKPSNSRVRRRFDAATR